MLKIRDKFSLREEKLFKKIREIKQLLQRFFLLEKNSSFKKVIEVKLLNIRIVSLIRKIVRIVIKEYRKVKCYY